MNNMRGSITKDDATPSPIGAAYTALLLASGEVRLVHATDDPEQPLEKRSLKNITLHTRGTHFLTAVHFSLLEVTHPVAFADGLIPHLIQPFLTTERGSLVRWLRVNLEHLHRHMF